MVSRIIDALSIILSRMRFEARTDESTGVPQQLLFEAGGPSPGTDGEQ
jgi:hypothetical protein